MENKKYGRDIWRGRNMKSRQFTFTQKHSSGFIQLRLVYIFISNTLQELVTMTDTGSYLNWSFSCNLPSLKRK